PPLQALTGEVGPPVVLAKVKHPGDVGVVEPGRRPRLPAQPLGGPAVAGQRPAEDLDRARPVQQRVPGDPHLPHPTGGQRRPHPVPAPEVAAVHGARTLSHHRTRTPISPIGRWIPPPTVPTW